MDCELPLDMIGRIERLVLAEMAVHVEEWSNWLADLNRWEDEHLLDNPTVEDLESHKKVVERMILFGKWVFMSATVPDYPDRKTAAMVSSTLATLKDKLVLWHGSQMKEKEAEQILSACFPHES